MKKAFYIFAFSFALLSVGSCREDELTEIPYANTAADSGVELITLDSTLVFGGVVYAYFHINYEVIADTSKIKNINVHRNGQHWFTLNPSQRTWFTDFNVVQGGTYEYQLFIRDKALSLSKGSAPFQVYVP